MQTDFPFVSICIPAYKNIGYLKRLLDSIAEQTFTDFEVILTDDSPDDSVEQFLKDYRSIKSLSYFKNIPACGTPENWNAAIRKARGQWIKLMHDDDWFTTKHALQVFAEASANNPTCNFFFSAFQNVIEETGEKQVVRCNIFDRFVLHLNPLHLFRRVYVGNPSCTFIKRDRELLYDNRFKFVVDFEYYIRVIKNYRNYQYIDDVLLSIGFNNEQVTKYTFLVPEVQIPENLLLLEKLGTGILRNILVYDYYWRMFRNLKVRNISDVRSFYEAPIPLLITQMIKFQSLMSLSLLKIGIISKTAMFFSYLRSLGTSGR